MGDAYIFLILGNGKYSMEVKRKSKNILLGFISHLWLSWRHCRRVVGTDTVL